MENATGFIGARDRRPELRKAAIATVGQDHEPPPSLLARV
jgi:hypothetical protein